MQLPVADLENFRYFPRKWGSRTGTDGAAIGRLEVASVSGAVIEEDKTEDNSSRFVNDRIAAITDQRDKMKQAGAELIRTRPSRGIHRRLERGIVFR